MNVLQKISLGFTAALGIAAIGSLTGVWLGTATQRIAYELEKDTEQELHLLEGLELNLLHALSHQHTLTELLLPSHHHSSHSHEMDIEKEEQLEKFNRFLASTQETWDELLLSYEEPVVEETDEEQALFNVLRTDYPDLIDGFNQQAILFTTVVEAADFTDNSSPELDAIVSLHDEITAEALGFIEQVRELEEVVSEEVEDAEAAQERSFTVRQNLIFASIALAVITAGFAAYLINRAIVRPLHLTTAIARQATQEQNFELQAPVISNDEIGSLSMSFNQLIQQVNALLTERQRQNRELIHATHLKDEFLANMSHELRTPLNAILGLTESLKEEVFGELNGQQHSALQTIERSSTHLLELINDILDVAKIEAGEMELEFTNTSVNQLCQSSLAFIKQQALKKKIQIDTKVSPDLPPLWVDGRRIRQVLINLLSNAVKFTPAGGHITLEVNHLHHATLLDSQQLDSQDSSTPTCEGLPKHDGLVDNCLRIAVADTGIGIAPDDIDKLFRPFTQIDSALNRQYQGTGLGLSLVKHIVSLHGGQVGVSSEVGVGSRFTVDLPCDHAHPSPTESIPSPVESIHLNPSDSTITPLILFAEDNEANINTISSYLKAKGYRLLIAKNGHEAIAKAQAEPPDLILMDIHMPELDGLETIQRLRQVPKFNTIPIIALTALAMPGDRERCLDAGATDYLSKPIRLKTLTHTIRHHLALQPTQSV